MSALCTKKGRAAESRSARARCSSVALVSVTASAVRGQKSCPSAGAPDRTSSPSRSGDPATRVTSTSATGSKSTVSQPAPRIVPSTCSRASPTSATPLADHVRSHPWGAPAECRCAPVGRRSPTAGRRGRRTPATRGGSAARGRRSA